MKGRAVAPPGIMFIMGVSTCGTQAVQAVRMVTGGRYSTHLQEAALACVTGAFPTHRLHLTFNIPTT